jgi:hypothetical protein
MQREAMTKNLSLKISEDDYEWLKNMADKEDRTIGGMARMAIKRWRSQEEGISKPSSSS